MRRTQLNMLCLFFKETTSRFLPPESAPVKVTTPQTTSTSSKSISFLFYFTIVFFSRFQRMILFDGLNGVIGLIVVNHVVVVFMSVLVYVLLQLSRIVPFHLANEICPLKNKNDWQIQKGTHLDQTRPISDHTRGGKSEIFLRLIFIYLFQ
jgi:hypothetical protein